MRARAPAIAESQPASCGLLRHTAGTNPALRAAGRRKADTIPGRRSDAARASYRAPPGAPAGSPAWRWGLRSRALRLLLLGTFGSLGIVMHAWHAIRRRERVEGDGWLGCAPVACRRYHLCGLLRLRRFPRRRKPRRHRRSRGCGRGWGGWRFCGRCGRRCCGHRWGRQGRRWEVGLRDRRRRGKSRRRVRRQGCFRRRMIAWCDRRGRPGKGRWCCDWRHDVGGGDRPLRLVDRQATGWAEAVAAAVDRGASWASGDAGFAQHRDGSALAQRSFQHAQLGIYAIERVELRAHDLVVALPESVEVEHEAAKVAVGKLASGAQEAGAAAHPAALEEARVTRRRIDWRRLRGGCFRGRRIASRRLLGGCFRGRRIDSTRLRGGCPGGHWHRALGCPALLGLSDAALLTLLRLRGVLDVPLSSEDAQH